MRSVFLLVEQQNRNVVMKNFDLCCDQSFESSSGEKQWNILKDGDGLFYICEISAETLFCEMEDEKYFGRIGVSKRKFACWQIDISGRHDGTGELLKLLHSLFSDLPGYVVDDYTNYFWTLAEIEKSVCIQGHPFFVVSVGITRREIITDQNKYRRRISTGRISIKSRRIK